MAVFMSSIGMDCVLNNTGKNVFGRLKNSPVDFIVNEIDMNGNIVKLNPDSTVPTLPASLTNPTPATCAVPSETMPSSDKDDSLATPTMTTSPFETSIESLLSLISPESFSMLQELSSTQDEFVRVGKAHEAVVNVGSFNNKSSRTIIHFAIRREFPSLKTVTKKTVEGVTEIHVVPDPAYSSLVPLIGPEESKRFLEFVNIAERSHSSVHYLPPDTSKAHRTEVHRTIDKLFGHLVETKSFVEPCPPPRKKRKTDTVGEKLVKDERKGDSADQIGKGPRICVRFRRKKLGSSVMKGQRTSTDWYLKFVLKKENMETLTAVSKLSGMLSCHPSQFSYAGLKDRRAVTTQWVTVKNVSANRFSALSHPFLQCGNYEYVTCPLRLGDLQGNHFQLKITDVSYNGDSSRETIEDIVKESMSSLQSNGFINYYGPQRFGLLDRGAGSITSALVGLAMLQKDTVKAVDLILEPIDEMSNPVAEAAANEAKSYYRMTGDIDGTISRMPENKTREILVLKALNRHGKTEYGCGRALLNIPYQMRLLYIHSFTSLLWNHLASFRIQHYGNEPVKGDLVLTNESAQKVRPLTEGDLSENKYTMYDIVLPVPGSKVTMPTNDVEQKLSELMSAVGVTLACFSHLKHLDLWAPGAYRSVIASPQIISWSLSDNKQPSMGEPPGSVGDDDLCGPSVNSSSSSLDIDLCFNLKPSCYATSMLRELLKIYSFQSYV